MKKCFLFVASPAAALLLLSAVPGGNDLPNKMDPVTLSVLDTMHTVTIGWPLEKLSKKVPRVVKFLDHLKKEVEAHNWNALIQVSDPANYKAQKEIGIVDHQYVYELLNVDSSITSDYVAKTKTILESIQTFSIERYNYSNDGEYRSFTFFGTLVLSNGSRKAFKLDVTVEKKALWLIGAVG